MAVDWSGSRVLVTGGAGFIGSHLVDALLAAGATVTVLDNLSTGSRAFLAAAAKSERFTLAEGDMLDTDTLARVVPGHDAVFHLAADPDVRGSAVAPEGNLKHNATATVRLLEAMSAAGVKRLGFTSTSAVYGDAAELPTPEDYGPLYPISMYGAAKLAGEAFVAAFCGTRHMTAVSYRFANVVGPRSNHGVTFDFVHKLRKDPTQLEILGDGSQLKSYFHVADCVSGMLAGFPAADAAPGATVLNIGSEDAVDVKTIAAIVTETLGLKDVAFRFTGGVDGGRGWAGDVKIMRLAVDRLKKLGWTPRYSSAEAIRETARAVQAEADAEGR